MFYYKFLCLKLSHAYWSIDQEQYNYQKNSYFIELISDSILSRYQ